MCRNQHFVHISHLSKVLSGIISDHFFIKLGCMELWVSLNTKKESLYFLLQTPYLDNVQMLLKTNGEEILP